MEKQFPTFRDTSAALEFQETNSDEFKPKFGGRCSSMRDLEVTKTMLPISIWGVPIQKWAGRLGYSHMGNPRFRIEFVSIWGPTYVPIPVSSSYSSSLRMSPKSP